MTKHTPLYDEHKKLKARFVEFGGWDMPVMYSSIIDEHNSVRQKAGIFDASHMGECILSGKDAGKFLNNVTVANVAQMSVGQAKYSLFLNEQAGIVDDLLIYKRNNDFFLVINASNTEKDLAWLKKNMSGSGDVTLTDLSPQLALIALQGPQAETLLQPLLSNHLKEIKNFTFFTPVFKSFSPDFALVSRTGYTGEDGFELFVSNETATTIWKQLLVAGAQPCGLGARDSLRLEACMSLHGHEITDDTTPLEAGLGWTIFWDKDFIGKPVLEKQKREGVKKYLTAFILDSGIPREKCAIMIDSKAIGTVTSGTFSPTLKKGICLGYISEKLEPGTTVTIVVHNQPRAAKIVKKPFYKKRS